MTDPRPLPYAWSEIRGRLQRGLPDLLRALDLKNDGHGSGGLVLPRNPTRNDRTPGSFVIWTVGDAVGGWRDYACGDAGDVIDLVGYVLRLRAKIDVYWWALDWLGLDRKGNADAPRSKADAEVENERRARERAAEAARQTAQDAERGASLFRLWLGLESFEGTPAETYLRQARGIDLSRLGKAPDAIRWARRVEWTDPRVDPETGEVDKVHIWENAMVTALTRGAKITGVHVTFLKADGSGKAGRSRDKLMFGAVRGAAMRLARGPSGLSPSEAAKKGKTGPLAIGEGIETCLTVAAARPDFRVWAAGSLSLMGLIDWPACATSVVLLGENDQHPEAVKAFGAVVRAWEAQAKGRPVIVAASAVGSDFNDWKMAG